MCGGQNVDANFSRIQQVMANRILPAVKRYAVGTEPVREAARRLVARGEVDIVQGGHVVDPSTAKGPIRLRRRH